MKKVLIIVGIVLVFFIIISIYNNGKKTNITLDQITEAFNKSSIVEMYKNSGGSIKAKNNNNKINVDISISGNTEEVELVVKKNILSIEIDKEDDDAFTKMYIVASIIDVIGQLNGYKEGELAQTINSEKTSNYTLEKEGYEMENISDTKVRIKIDISKKIPLADFSNDYIEISDLEDFKKYIYGDGFAETSKGNIRFNKSGYDGENTILISEKGGLTENTYKSILSILEVMFNNDEVVEYFKENYPNIYSGDKTFNGFVIKINPIKSELEESWIPSNSGYEFVRINVDKSTVNINLSR